MPRSNRHVAFTLIELLVVLAIIGVLIGLLVPAVQKIRAAAARTQCLNNLKQLGLALHQYHDAQRVLPPGCSYLDGKHPQPHMSWLTRLLPYLEQEALWRQAQEAFALEPFFQQPPHHLVLSYKLPMFTCPADDRAQQIHSYGFFSVAFTSYLGVIGTDYSQRTGVLFLDSKTRLLDIRDGTSNTLAVGERPPSRDRSLGWWYAGWGQAKDGSVEMVMGVRERNIHERYPHCRPGPHTFAAEPESDCDHFHFWSRHTGGGHFLFADGSVRFLSYSAAPTLSALASHSGGEVIND